MSQGRVVYLGYLAVYPNPYRIEVDYLDGSGSPNTYPSPNFAQAPGTLFAIPDLSRITAVRLYDAITGSMLGQYDMFVASCGTCWPTAQMFDIARNPGIYRITWDPSSNIVVIVDSNVFASKKEDDEE